MQKPGAKTGTREHNNKKNKRTNREVNHHDTFHFLHDILRQYDSDGRLVRSLVSRNSMSTERRHPMWNAQMATSKYYVAIVSNVARKWVLVSSEGIIVRTGSFAADATRGNFRGFVAVAVTDSGRIFGHALFRKNNRVDATFRATQVARRYSGRPIAIRRCSSWY